jgi:hypothetical protein
LTERPLPHRPATVRWLGAAGTALMAVGGYPAGAYPWDARPPTTAAIGGWHVAGLVVWCAGALLLLLAWWGGLGLARRGAATGGWMLATAALWAVPLLLAPPLASHDVYAYACQGQLWASGVDPYRTGPSGPPCTWLWAVPPIWRDTPSPYGPLAVLVAGAAAAGSGGHLLVAVGWLRLSALVGVALLTWAVPRLATACGGDPRIALWLSVANPLMLIHLVSGAHNDALLVGLVVAALALAAGGRPVPSAVLLGLAVAVKVTAVVALPFAALLAYHLITGPRRWPRLAGYAGLAAAAYLVLALVTGLDLAFLRNLPTTAGAYWLSVPSGVGMALGAPLQAAGVPDGIALGVRSARAVALYAVLPAAVAALCWRVRRSADPAALAGAAGRALAVAVLCAPLVYPWYAVTALAVLAAAAPGRRLVTGLAAVSTGLVFVVLPDSVNLARLTRWPGAVLELAALVAVAGWWLRRWWLRRCQPVSSSMSP